MVHGHMTIHYRVRWDSGLLSESDNFLSYSHIQHVMNAFLWFSNFLLFWFVLVLIAFRLLRLTSARLAPLAIILDPNKALTPDKAAHNF